MRVKLVPPPPDALGDVVAAQRAVPLVPRSEHECWSNVAERLGLESRDVARTWLTFLRGLGFVERGSSGFVRTRLEPDRASIAAGLRDGVFLAEELLVTLGCEPRSPGEAFDHVADRIPRWERERDPNWEETWRRRVEHLLAWLVLVDLARRTGSGYARV